MQSRLSRRGRYKFLNIAQTYSGHKDKKVIKVLVVDAQWLMAESLRAALRRQPDFQVLDQNPTSGLKAVEAVLRSKPDVTLLDYWMEGMEGPAATRLILRKAPGLKILILGWFHGPAEIIQADRAGATAMLSKSLNIFELVEAIRRAAAGQPLTEFQEMVKGGAGRGTEPDAVWEGLVTLTPREIEILSYLSASGRPEEVASGLSLTTGTVRLHIRHILSKIGARSHVEAVVIAREHGLI